MAAIFTYGFEVARARFESAGVPLVTLTSYPVLIGEAVRSGLVSADMVRTLEAWREDPAGWDPSV